MILVEGYKNLADYQVDRNLYQFIEQEVLPGLDIKVDEFFSKLLTIVSELTKENQDLLIQRDKLQSQIDKWHKNNTGSFDLQAYKIFLEDIGYLLPKPAPGRDLS
jgi:Malate synthase